MFKYILVALGFVFNIAHAQQEPDTVVEGVNGMKNLFVLKESRKTEMVIGIKEDGTSDVLISFGEKFPSLIENEDDPWYGENPLVHANKIVKLHDGSEAVVVVASLSNGRACEHNTRILIAFDKTLVNKGYENGYEQIDQCYFNDIYIEMQEYHKVLGDAVSVGFSKGKSLIQYDLLLNRFKK